MIVATQVSSSTSLLGASSAIGIGPSAFTPSALHERALSSSPPLSSSPSRGHGLQVFASAYCPPRSATRISSSSTRFAPALSKRKVRRRRSGSSSGDGGDGWGDGDFFFQGPWDGFDDLGGNGGHGRYGGRGGSGGGGGSGGWDRSNSEFGDWPALAGMAWVWQGICAASLIHSLFFLVFPQKHTEPSVPPFSAQPACEGLC